MGRAITRESPCVSSSRVVADLDSPPNTPIARSRAGAPSTDRQLCALRLDYGANSSTTVRSTNSGAPSKISAMIFRAA